MKNIKEFKQKNIKYVFTDIDDTLTTDGSLTKEAYTALWDLKTIGLSIVPITGRPAGWCEMIARFWPVLGVIGENGGFYFAYDRQNKKMQRKYIFSQKDMAKNTHKLQQLKTEILDSYPQLQISSDQFCRQMDLAIDFAEDVGPFSDDIIDGVLAVCKKHGAQAKVSSIHINTWFGNYDKLSMCQTFTKDIIGFHITDILDQSVFCGDSPNDEPMFGFFKHSIAVANFIDFQDRVDQLPKYICDLKGGHGFAQITKQLLKLQGK